MDGLWLFPPDNESPHSIEREIELDILIDSADLQKQSGGANPLGRDVANRFREALQCVGRWVANSWNSFTSRKIHIALLRFLSEL